MRLVAIALLAGCGSGAPSPASPPPPERDARQPSLSVETRYFDHEVTYTVRGSKMELATLPMREWVGLPGSGSASIEVMVRVPLVDGQRDWSRAEGEIELACERCQIGDDQAKLPVGDGGGFAGDGISFGHLAFSTIGATLRLTGGSVELTAWKVESTDVKVELSGRASLMPTLDESHVEACLRFASTPELTRRDPLTASVLGITGAAVAGDGMYNIRISGPLSAPRRLAQVCDGSQPIDETNAPVAQTHTQYADLEAAIDQGITKVNETTYEVSLGLISKMLENPMAVAKGARIVPAMKNGTAQGLKLYAIRPSSVFAKLGFANGDLLTTIGGYSVTNGDQALEVYTKLQGLKAGDRFEVELTRRGKPVTLTYTLNP